MEMFSLDEDTLKRLQKRARKLWFRYWRRQRRAKRGW